MTSVPQPDERLLAMLGELMPAPESSLAKARVRARVMSVAREQLEPRTSPLFGPVGFAAAAASAVVALGSGGAIGASANALPGDALYPLKMVVEEVQSAIAVAANDPVAHVAVEEERASKRVAEIESLAAKNRPIPTSATEAAVARSAAAADAAANAAARAPEAVRPSVEQKHEAAQIKREETLTRVITQVPPPAQTAIANTLERQAARQDDRQERRDERQEERDARRDDRENNSGPGSNGNRGGSGSGSSNAIPALTRATERAILAPPPTATARPDERRRVEPTPPPRGRAAESARPGPTQTPPGRSGQARTSSNSSGPGPTRG